MRVLLASPTYGHAEPVCSRALRIAVMTASNHGHHWAGDASTDRMDFANARNHAAEFFLDHLCGLGTDGADGIVWVDSDTKPAPDSIQRLLYTVEFGPNAPYDFLSGVYHDRRGEHRPSFYHTIDEANFKVKQNILYEDNQILQEGACGFGFCFTSRKLLIAISELPGFSRERGKSFFFYGDVSEDFHFCRLAAQAGFQLYVDTGIQIPHLGDPQFVTKETYLQALAAKSGGKLPTVVSVVTPFMPGGEPLARKEPLS